MAVHHLSQLVVLVIWIAHLPYAIGASCVADNVLRAFRAEAEVGVLDCQYILGIPQPTAVITSVSDMSSSTVRDYNDLTFLDDICYLNIYFQNENYQKFWNNDVSFLRHIRMENTLTDLW